MERTRIRRNRTVCGTKTISVVEASAKNEDKCTCKTRCKKNKGRPKES